MSNFIKTIRESETAPYGLSRAWQGGPLTLRLPLFPWYGKAYRLPYDDVVTGWWVKDLWLRFGTDNRQLGR